MNNLSLYLYIQQQEINNFLILQIYQITWISYIAIFIGGLFTSANPCILSALPVTIGYINKTKNQNINGLIFILGTLTSIILIGLSSLILNKNHLIFFEISNFMQPIIILFIGFNLLNIIKLPINTSFTLNSQNFLVNEFMQTYLLGLTVGFNISPCTTPILITTITWIGTTKNILNGIILLIFYSTGYTIPIILSLISFRNISNMNIVNPIWNNIIPLSGSIIVATGTFSLLHNLLSTITL